MIQQTLFDIETETQFRRYHAENPQIYRMFCFFAMEKINAGAKHLGSKAVIERIRWETFVTANDDTYKIRNTFTPHYARLFMKDHPQYAGFFETRTSVADVEGVS